MRTTAIPVHHKRAVPVRRKKLLFSHFVEVTLSLALLLGAAVFAVYVPRSSYFSVQEITFENQRVLGEADIREAAGITVDDNILFLDVDAVRARVESLPYVKRCDVVKSIREKKVHLRIVERKAAATVMLNNHLFEVDRELVVLRELSPFSIHSGPLITSLPDVQVLEAGKAIESPELKAALDLWQAFQTLPFADQLTLSELSAESTTQLRMYFEELPYEMRWGRSDFETQANRLAILWEEMGGFIPCEYYLDLRFDANLACK
ncbi:MAG: FtsQ-type POTRA domain-containing protein [Candidatus Hydrogenedentes bacterium]|jgi:cell division septal protein FtsQ|nr:FtsQ-type POTRA domain-containing protein [Candidatus Hydrogenedentota bacterium]